MLNIVKKYFFLIIIIIFLFSFYFFELDNYFTLKFLQENRLLVEEFVDSYPLHSFFALFMIHVLLLACFIPASLGIFITAGFFFHPLFAIFFSTLFAVIGGVINFFTIKKTFNLRYNKKVNKIAKNFETGLKKNEFFYLILLRLIPSPFVIQNAITVFFKINLKNFIFSTFLGILPWSIVYCTIGSGLHDLIETTDGLTFNDLINFKIISPILGLVCLIIISLIFKKHYLTDKN